jgi:hypothetical protein
MYELPQNETCMKSLPTKNKTSIEIHGHFKSSCHFDICQKEDTYELGKPMMMPLELMLQQ